MVNGLRGTAPFYVAGAALDAPDAAVAWHVQHLHRGEGIRQEVFGHFRLLILDLYFLDFFSTQARYAS